MQILRINTIAFLLGLAWTVLSVNAQTTSAPKNATETTVAPKEVDLNARTNENHPHWEHRRPFMRRQHGPDVFHHMQANNHHGPHHHLRHAPVVVEGANPIPEPASNIQVAHEKVASLNEEEKAFEMLPTKAEIHAQPVFDHEHHRFPERIHSNHRPVVDSLVHFTAGESSEPAITSVTEAPVVEKTNNMVHDFMLRQRGEMNSPMRVDSHLNHWHHFAGARPIHAAPESMVIRSVNRPSDIIIRNTFRERPKSWIDLRISIDDNGVLNVEAGPNQGAVSVNSSSINVPLPRQPTGNTEDSFQKLPEREQSVDIEDMWSNHHKNSDAHLSTWVSPSSSLSHEYPPMSRFHQQRNQPGENQIETRVQKQGKTSQHEIMGPSIPPFIPDDEKPNEHLRMMRPSGGSNQNRQDFKEPVHEASQMSRQDMNELPNGDPVFNEIIERASSNENNENKQNNVEKEEEVKPVVNIDDFGSSGCKAENCKGKTCPGGLFKLSLDNGCPTCDCCPVIQCRIKCQDGYESDSYGCPICRCLTQEE